MHGMHGAERVRCSGHIFPFVLASCEFPLLRNIFFVCGKLRCGHSMTENVNKREICRMRASAPVFSTSTTYLRMIFIAENVRGWESILKKIYFRRRYQQVLLRFLKLASQIVHNYWEISIFPLIQCRFDLHGSWMLKAKPWHQKMNILPSGNKIIDSAQPKQVKIFILTIEAENAMLIVQKPDVFHVIPSFSLISVPSSYNECLSHSTNEKLWWRIRFCSTVVYGTFVTAWHFRLKPITSTVPHSAALIPPKFASRLFLA